jgi:outer membrane protein assembly factor BamB
MAGSVKGDLIALRATDGTLQWSHRFTGRIRSMGHGDDNVLYVGTVEGIVYAYSRSTGGATEAPQPRQRRVLRR